MLYYIVTHQSPCDHSVLLQVVRLHLFINGEPTFNRSLAVGEDEQLLTEGPKLWIRLHGTAQEDVQPLLHGRKGEEVLTPALQGQETVKLLQYDIPYDKTDEKKLERNIDNSLAIASKSD